ncbi:hypothetical protein [Flavobacterium sp.]|uniref:hypothetical protein n=1 Tax=Flavobacterium sp. TaxID=239 RepID=UPI002B4B9001|nr:hypothetical protein [Flavobacterium sp.]HLF51508.1 hypothetical protein [Flavobacterium sp.]
MPTIWSKNKDSSSTLSALSLEEGIYTFVFENTILTKYTILAAAQKYKDNGLVENLKGKKIEVIGVRETQKQFEIDIEVTKGEGSPTEAGFVSVSLLLGALGIVAIWFLIEVRKTFTPKTIIPLAAVAIGGLVIASKFFK